MKRQLHQVSSFHHKFQDRIQHFPSVNISDEKKQLRKRLMREEIEELCAAMDQKEIMHIAKELVDVLYVVLGTALVYGLGSVLPAVFSAVHKSNMSRV